MPGRIRSLGRALGVIAVVVLGVPAAAFPRVLPPAAMDTVRAALGRLAPPFRPGNVSMHPQEVDSGACLGAGDCAAFRLSDPTAGCSGDVAGNWCVEFRAPPKASVRQAVLDIFSIGDDPWVEAQASPPPPPSLLPSQPSAGVDHRDPPASPPPPSYVVRSPDPSSWVVWSFRVLGGLLACLALVTVIGIGMACHSRAWRSAGGRRRMAVLALTALLALPGLEGAYRGVLYLAAREAVVDRFDVFAVGGSTMLGEPYEVLSIPILLGMAFDGRIDGRTMVITNFGRPGHSIYPQWVQLQRRLVGRDPSIPGVVLIYSGHNEGFVSPDQERELSPLDLLEGGSLLARDLVFAPRMRNWLQRRASFWNYEHYLRRVIETSLNAGLVPILSTVVSNTSGIEPNVPMGIDLERARAVLAPGDALEAAGRMPEAALEFQRARDREPDLAALLDFRAAKALEASGDTDAARDLYDRVVSEDPRTRFGRATPAQNELVRRLAREYGIPLVDSVDLFKAASPHGLIGNSLFADGHHPNLDGYLLIARGFQRALSDRFGVPPGRTLEREGALKAVGAGSRNMSPHIKPSMWLLSASVQHPCPRGRLELARWHLEEAVKDDPDSLWAWVGLAVVQGALNGRLLWEPSDLEAIARLGVGFQAHLYLEPEDVEPTIRLLREAGAEPRVLERLERFEASAW